MGCVGGSKALLLAAVVLAFASRSALPATIKSSLGKDGRAIIAITGEIVGGDNDAFVNAVKVANAAGKLVANVRLNSEGGNLLEGVKLADSVRTGKIATNVGRRPSARPPVSSFSQPAPKRMPATARKLECTERQIGTARRPSNLVPQPYRWLELRRSSACRRPSSAEWSSRRRIKWSG